MTLDLSSPAFPSYRTAVEAALSNVLSEIRSTGSMSKTSLEWVTTVAPYLGRERLAELQRALKIAAGAPSGQAISATAGRVTYSDGGAILHPTSLGLV